LKFIYSMKNIRFIGNGFSQSNGHFLYQKARPGDAQDSAEAATPNADTSKKSPGVQVKEEKVYKEAKDIENKIKDEAIYKKHEKLWNERKSYYVKNAEELKSVIRHSLSHLDDVFEDAEDLKASVDRFYDRVLSQQECADLYSFIEHGCSEKEAKDRKEDASYLQRMLNKIASSPSDTDNDQLTGILESNSSKKGGIDNMWGIVTARAARSLVIRKIKKIIGKTEKQDDDKDSSNLATGLIQGFKKVVGTLKPKPGDDDAIIDPKEKPGDENLDDKIVPIVNPEDKGGSREKEEYSPIEGIDPGFDKIQPGPMETPPPVVEYKRGKTTLTIKHDFLNLENKQWENFDRLTRPTSTLGSFNKLGDFSDGFKTEYFDKGNFWGNDTGNGISYTGELRDWNTLDDLGTGPDYRVKFGDYDINFGYNRGPGGIRKVLNDFKLNYNGKEGNINVTAAEAGRDITPFDKNDPTSEGYKRWITDLKVNMFNEVKLDIGSFYKTETPKEVSASVRDVHMEIGGWKLDAEGLSGAFQTPNADFDLSEILKDIKDGKAGMSDLMERLSFDSGVVSLVSPDGATRLLYDGANIFYNNFRIFRDEKGNFNFLDMNNQGARFNGGFESYTIVNGQSMSTGAFLDTLIHGGADIMLNSPEVEHRTSVFGGALVFNTEVGSNLSEEKRDKCGMEIRNTFKSMFENVSDFSKIMKEGSVGNMIEEGGKLRVNLEGQYMDLIDYVKKEGGIELENWEVSFDFEKLAENFELIGEQGAANALYSLKLTFEAMGNTFGKVTLNQEVLDGYKAAENKGDYAMQHLGWGANMKEVKNNMLDQAKVQFGSIILEQPMNTMMDVLSATNGGSAEGLILSEKEFTAYYNFMKKADTGWNLLAYVNGDIGESNTETVYVQGPSKKPNEKEQFLFGADHNTKLTGGLLVTKVILDKKGSTLKGIMGVGGSINTISNAQLAVTDGENTYSIASADKLLGLGQGLGLGNFEDERAFLDNAEKNGVFALNTTIGLDFQQRIGGRTTLGTTALLSGTPQKGMPLALKLNLRAEQEFNIGSFPATMGVQMNTSNLLNGQAKEYKSGAAAELILRVNLQGNKDQYLKNGKLRQMINRIF